MKKKVELRPIDKVLSQFSEGARHPGSAALQVLAVPLLSFGILGLVWSVPFPQLGFLGKYSGFINWASFLIAFCIYYYYKLSPVLSYGPLLMVFAFSAGIVNLEKLHLAGEPALPVLSFSALLSGLIAQLFVYRLEGKNASLKERFRFLLDGPLWLFYFLFKKAGFRI